MQPARTFAVAAGLLVPTLWLLPALAGAGGQPAWKSTASVSARESYDSNVFLQDTAPGTTVAGAAQPREGSLVSTVSASISFGRKLGPTVEFSASYAPEATWYQSAASENNVTHRTTLGLTGTDGATTWSLTNALTWIDGSRDGPIFGCTGGVPAVGGIPLRDRRAAFVLRSGFKLTHTMGRWFLRPVATLYVHDFHTRQSRAAGYENYISRQEWIGGVDAGYRVAPKTFLVAEFRYGRQDQFRLFGVDSPYDSRIRRFLAGFESAPATWLQVAVLGGPETRTFAPGTPAGFDRHKVLLWMDASVKVTPDKRDACTLAIRRYEQPAFSSQSMYQDTTYEISWRRAVTDRLAATAGFKAYNGGWQAPVVRNDWIFTPSVTLQYAVSRQCGVELGTSFDRAKSEVPSTPGREYRRQIGYASAKWTF